MKLDRRKFLGISTGVVGTAMIPMSSILQADSEDPHFFLNITFPGGMDAHYLFDARPLSLTKAEKFANYMPSEPTEYVGINGMKTLRTTTTDSLMKFKDRFTILNGVHMIPAFDGHPQNLNFLMTGSAFGGESFVPHLNQAGKKTPLDFVKLGDGISLVNDTNSGKGIQLDTKSTQSLIDKLEQLSEVDTTSDLSKHLLERMEIAANGQGSYSYSASEMAIAFKDIPELKSLLEKIDLPDTDPENQTAKDSIAMVGEFFKGGLCKSAQYIFNTDFSPDRNLDTHDGMSAAQSPTIITSLMSELAEILEYLSETPYDDTRSLLDVTTVLAGSEFGRTARQTYGPIESSGTDHNPLTNSFLIAGKGIVGGMVVGQSDLQTISEFEGEATGAHLELDEGLIKAMGRPFDFDTFEVSDSAPESYSVENYLNVGSVVNTVYKIFGVPEEQYRLLERNGDIAPVLDNIIS